MAIVLSYDQENDPDTLSIIGASAALAISGIPFPVRLGAVRIGLGPSGYIVNPTSSQLEDSRLNITVVGTKDSVVMVEGNAQEVTEQELLGAIKRAQEILVRIIEIQDKLRDACGKEKRSYSPPPLESSLEERVVALASDPVSEALQIQDKEARRERLNALQDHLNEDLCEEYPGAGLAIARIVGDIQRNVLRRMILGDHKRVDGRGPDDIRPITCMIGVLPRTHGSALFTRGQTQALTVVTLGTSSDEQRIDDSAGESSKASMLHCHFPPFSGGEGGPRPT